MRVSWILSATPDCDDNSPMQDKPREAEFSIRRGPDGLEISMPVKGPVSGKGALVLWLMFWGCLEVAGLFAVWQQLTGRAEGVGDFPVGLVVLGWTVFGVFVLNTLNMQTRGREVLILRADVLIIKRGVENIGSTDEYELSRVKNLRYQLRQPNFLDGKGGPGPWAGPVAFDYGSRIVRCGKGVSERAAREIIEIVGGYRHVAGGSGP